MPYNCMIHDTTSSLEHHAHPQSYRTFLAFKSYYFLSLHLSDGGAVGEQQGRYIWAFSFWDALWASSPTAYSNVALPTHTPCKWNSQDPLVSLVLSHLPGTLHIRNHLTAINSKFYQQTKRKGNIRLAGSVKNWLPAVRTINELKAKTRKTLVNHHFVVEWDPRYP